MLIMLYGYLLNQLSYANYVTYSLQLYRFNMTENIFDRIKIINKRSCYITRNTFIYSHVLNFNVIMACGLRVVFLNSIILYIQVYVNYTFMNWERLLKMFVNCDKLSAVQRNTGLIDRH